MSNRLDRATSQILGQSYTRRGLLKGTLAAGAGAVALSAFGGHFAAPGAAAAAAATVAAGPLDSDLEILNYALTLEYLEADAYAAINRAGILTGRAAAYFRDFGAHEAAHVDAITATITKLGGRPVQRPAGGFNFTSVPKDAAGVVRFFQMVESVGVSAYLGAAPSIKDPDILEAALSIHAIEAEHAAALADLAAEGTDLFAPAAFEKPRTPDEVLQIVAPFLAPAAPAPAPAPAPQPAMPGLPNTGGGGATGGDGLQTMLGLLGLAGAGAAAAALSRRRAADGEARVEARIDQE